MPPPTMTTRRLCACRCMETDVLLPTLYDSLYPSKLYTHGTVECHTKWESERGMTESPKRFWIWTVGCQMNKVDSDRVAATLRGRGYLPAEREEDADIIILNSCAVRESAERRVSGKLGNLVALKQERPELLIGLTGCSVSPDFDATEKRFRGADLYFQPTRIDQFVEQLNQHWPEPTEPGIMA